MEKKNGYVAINIPWISGLTTITGLSTKLKENDDKITCLSGLVKKKDCDAKIPKIQRKYFTNSDYDKFTSDMFDIKIQKKVSWSIR